MKLSARLAAVVEAIAYPIIADIGCDHGYACISAVLSGRVIKAYACDANPGPLASAAENIRKHGLLDKIIPLQGDGLAPVRGTDTQTVIISGLGGYQTIEILTGLHALPDARQLILQPMNGLPDVRKYVYDIGYAVQREQLIYDNGAYYFIFDCAPGPGEPYTVNELQCGRVAGSDTYRRYIRSEIGKCKRIIEKIDAHAARASENRDAHAARLAMLNDILRGTDYV